MLDLYPIKRKRKDPPKHALLFLENKAPHGCHKKLLRSPICTHAFVSLFHGDHRHTLSIPAPVFLEFQSRFLKSLSIYAKLAKHFSPASHSILANHQMAD